MTSNDARSTRTVRHYSALGLLLPREHGSARYLPLLFGLLVVVCGSIMGHHQWAAEHAALEKATAAALREVSSAVDARMQAQLAAIGRLRTRWMNQRGMSQRVFESHAGSLVADFEHIRAIDWVDRDYVVRWMVKTDGVPSLVGTRLWRTPDERATLDRIRSRASPTVSPPTDLLDGHRGFIVTYPLEVDGDFDGFLLGVYEAEEVFSAMISHVATSFDIDVTDATGPIWKRSGRDADPRYAQSTTVEMNDQVWKITVTPIPELVSTYLTPLPAVALAGSVVMGALFASALRGTWMGRLRNERLRQANSRLASEVTRRKQAEEAENAARDELASVVNSLPAYVWSAIAEPDGSITIRYQSRFIESISGLPVDRFKTREDWAEFVHPDDREDVMQAFTALVDGDIDEDASEYRFIRPDGEVRFLRQRVKVSNTAEGRRLDGIALDFTDLHRAEEERAQLEARMQETQRLESLGGLAGGIAHDFNNLLVAMLGHASLAREALAPDDPAQRSLSSIERAAGSAADLCRQMLAYAGMGSVVEERIDLRQVVEEMRDLLRASIPRTISVEAGHDGEAAGVAADPSQLQQVVLNLITNAAEAIGDRPGRIEVVVSHREFDEADLSDFLLGETLEPGRYVELVVKDDGCGMDEETRRRIFEPFYSTKFQGRGLGLAAVLGIVRRCRGALSIQSSPGQGTRMTVLLRPVALPADVAPPVRTPLPTEVDGGHVLVVDDDEAVREFAATVLERAGHRVSQAADGVEGLEFFEKHAHDVQCVLLDLTMPRMDGVETGRRMREIDPHVALLLSSGYPESDAMKRFGRLGVTGFLQKPYEPARLADVVRSAMRARSDRAADGRADRG